MRKNELYERARQNKNIANKDYLTSEIKDIIQAQFHYFLYCVKTENSLNNCAFSNFNQDKLKEINTEILNFKKNNLHIFEKDIKSFNIVILHLLINKPQNLAYKKNKI